MGTTWGGGKVRVSSREMKRNDKRNQPFQKAYEEQLRKNEIHMLRRRAKDK